MDASRYYRIRRRVRKTVQYFVMRNIAPLTPHQLRAYRASPRVFANSIPKAGTNLLSRLLKMMPNVVPAWTYHIDETMDGAFRQLRSGKRGQIITAHMPWTQKLAEVLEEEQYKKVFIVRDMRDVIVSGLHYVTKKDRSHPLHAYMKSLPDDDSRLTSLIKGVDAAYYPNQIKPDSWYNDSYRSFIPWIDDSDCCLLRFEDLIGEQGGGSGGVQAQQISKLAAHLGIDLDRNEVTKISANLFSSSSRTFRKGQIGDWVYHFSDFHKEIFKEYYGELLIRLGYEEDGNW